MVAAGEGDLVIATHRRHMDTEEALRRVRQIAPMLRVDVRTAVRSHAVLEAANDIVARGELTDLAVKERRKLARHGGHQGTIPSPRTNSLFGVAAAGDSV